jgi:hypothetical protein
VTSTQVNLRFTDADGRGHTLSALLEDDGDWVIQSCDGRTHIKRCGSWQSVERVLFRLRHSQERAAPASYASGTLLAAAGMP